LFSVVSNTYICTAASLLPVANFSPNNQLTWIYLKKFIAMVEKIVFENFKQLGYLKISL
jgi:hypothetical protein